MKSIMISIQPQWVEKILNGEKTIEIRKTIPKCELPCKVYIYCTKGKQNLYIPQEFTAFEWDDFSKPYLAKKPILEDIDYLANGKVVAEFTLNKITEHLHNLIDFKGDKTYNFCVEDVKNAGFRANLGNFDRFIKEYGKGKPLYAWHMDDLKIYDTPRALSGFKTAPYCFNVKNIEFKENAFGDYILQYHENSFCKICKYYNGDWGDCTKGFKEIKRPPTNYIFVE